ncbi:MAG: hypothetical protein JNK76_20535 [Planctomycetales bacterium]|nr:hypothetical protein [Planctomycetales bacterium]
MLTMPITSLTGAKTQYLANSSYDLNASASECALFIEACRALMLLLPKRGKNGRLGQEAEYDPEQVAKQLAKAERWHSANASGAGAGSVVKASFETYRD